MDVTIGQFLVMLKRFPSPCAYNVLLQRPEYLSLRVDVLYHAYYHTTLFYTRFCKITSRVYEYQQCLSLDQQQFDEGKSAGAMPVNDLLEFSTTAMGTYTLLQ